MTKYFVMRTVNYRSFTAVTYIGKGDRHDLIPYSCNGWSRRRFAENWIEEHGCPYECGYEATYEIIELK